MGVLLCENQILRALPRAGAPTIADRSKPAFDFAVLRLQDRLGDDLGYFGAKPYDDGWNDGNYWTLVGYPGAIANGQEPSFQMGISFHDDDEDSNDHGDAMELETQDGDASPGDSGGPMFGVWDDGPYIVAVLVGAETEYFFFPFSHRRQQC